MPVKTLVALGTRPEAIKLAPVILHMQSRPDDFDVQVCVTGQHREMLDQVLTLFDISPDFDLNLMRPGQDLFDITTGVISGLKPVLRSTRPEWLLVQGDTTTVWAAALAAYYENIRVGHIEAGLRSFDKKQPFPEEINRRICSQLADLHFAPTDRAKKNLLAENIPAEQIVVTGNTVIDALMWVQEKNRTAPTTDVGNIERWIQANVGDAPMVLITGHRRESFGAGFENICQAIAKLAELRSDVHWVYPVHLNPNVQEPVCRILGRQTNVHLLAPQAYASFVWLMGRSVLILTDSGGIQEEAPSMGKPVLVMRNTTERPEGVETGLVKLVGNSKESIVSMVRDTLEGRLIFARTDNPYGDGHASSRVAVAILRCTTPDL